MSEEQILASELLDAGEKGLHFLVTAAKSDDGSEHVTTCYLATRDGSPRLLGCYRWSVLSAAVLRATIARVTEVALVADTRSAREGAFGQDEIFGPVVSAVDEHAFRVRAVREPGTVWLLVEVGAETSGEFTPHATVITWPLDRASRLMNALDAVGTVFSNPLEDPDEVMADLERILEGYRRRLGMEVAPTGKSVK